MPRLNPGHVLKSLVPSSRDHRVYLLAVLTNIYGTGLIFATLPLFGIKVAHLTAARTGLAMTIAGLVSLLATMPIGRLADRRGPRDVYRMTLFRSGAAAAAYVFLAHNFVSFLIVTTADGISLSSAVTANVALIRRGGGGGAGPLRSPATAA